MSGQLQLAVTLRRGDLDLDIGLQVQPGEVVAIVGPNGAGKSTLLHLIAGLLSPDAGAIQIGARTLVDTARDVQLPPAARDIGVVFQSYRLFTHMSVLDNVVFGPRTGRRQTRADSRRRALEWLDTFGLAEQAGKKPTSLSGGQQQRVAVARALASDPACLLLDEPLAALDAESRADARRVLRTHLAAFDGPVLMVTHEPLEALALADQIVVLEEGRVTQTGSPADVARRPRSEWIAQLVGLNLFRGHRTGSQVDLADGGTIHVPGPNTGLAGRTDREAPRDATGEESVLAAVHPRSVSLHRAEPAGSPRNIWRGHLGQVEFAGDRVRVEVEGTPPIVAEVTAQAVADLDLAGGGAVWVSFKASEVAVYRA
ncbi:ABC transporter ATP-binding protein [Euzebya tangerina]|uniref:ABC transporter ATP-binding protein n=1 Tax=Euzebya tangerina TaxID=591198 RepID=UPI000E315D01|nr:ABC transporter ATP-binding protein [Euzebya tangerina]